jgi:hypothetical protein
VVRGSCAAVALIPKAKNLTGRSLTYIVVELLHDLTSCRVPSGFEGIECNSSDTVLAFIRPARQLGSATAALF